MNDEVEGVRTRDKKKKYSDPIRQDFLFTLGTKWSSLTVIKINL